MEVEPSAMLPQSVQPTSAIVEHKARPVPKKTNRNAGRSRRSNGEHSDNNIKTAFDS